jgi:hypothetical protein
MKTELASFTLNTSTAFQVAPANLGWSAMPAFPAAAPEREIALGWDAMPAFGESFALRSSAANVAALISSAPAADRKSSLLGSFWSAMSRLAHA